MIYCKVCVAPAPKHKDTDQDVVVLEDYGVVRGGRSTTRSIGEIYSSLLRHWAQRQHVGYKCSESAP